LYRHGQHVVHHVAESVPEEGIVKQRAEIVEAVEAAPLINASIVPQKPVAGRTLVKNVSSAPRNLIDVAPAQRRRQP
jgi:hypothetical protein